jgi:hypothetical protein
VNVVRILEGSVDGMDPRLQTLLHTAALRVVNREGRLSLHVLDRDHEEIVRVLETLDPLGDESDRQMILLGLALLSLQRPGWVVACEMIAKKLKGETMFREFRTFNEDRVYPDTPMGEPL